MTTTVPFVVDGCSINGAAGLVVPAALRRTVLRFAVCGWVPSGVAWFYAPYGVAGESFGVLSHSRGLRVGQCASSPPPTTTTPLVGGVGLVGQSQRLMLRSLALRRAPKPRPRLAITTAAP